MLSKQTIVATNQLNYYLVRNIEMSFKKYTFVYNKKNSTVLNFIT